MKIITLVTLEIFSLQLNTGLLMSQTGFSLFQPHQRYSYQQVIIAVSSISFCLWRLISILKTFILVPRLDTLYTGKRAKKMNYSMDSSVSILFAKRLMLWERFLVTLQSIRRQILRNSTLASDINLTISYQ